MSDRLLFWAPTLIWATTWHVILYQLGTVPSVNSVAYRFAAASVMLFGLARWRGERLPQSARLHGWLMLTGAIQYGVNYVGTYEAEQHITSGLMAVLFSLMVFGNALAGALFFGRPITSRFIVFATMGVAGVALIFWPDLIGASAKPQFLSGLGMGLMAVGFATLGNVLTLRLTRQGLALVPLLAWSMGYGALALLGFAAASGLGWHLDPRPSYWLALLYLSAFGSVAAFLLYFKLAHRHGPGRAALTSMVIPVVALAVSAALEGWRPTLESGLGMLLCLGGLWGASRPAPVTAGG